MVEGGLSPKGMVNTDSLQRMSFLTIFSTHGINRGFARDPGGARLCVSVLGAESSPPQPSLFRVIPARPQLLLRFS